MLNISRNRSFLIGGSSRRLPWFVNDFHLLGLLRFMTGREQHEEVLFFCFVLCALQWHKPALVRQTHAERYLISEAS